MRQKVILLCIVLTSVLVVAAAIIRLTETLNTFWNYDKTCKSKIIIRHDEHRTDRILTPGTYTDIGIWSSIEESTGLFCASVVAIKPLVLRLFPKFRSWAESGRVDNSGNIGILEKMGSTKSQHGGDDETELDVESGKPRQTGSSNLAWSEKRSRGESQSDDDLSDAPRRLITDADNERTSPVTMEAFLAPSYLEFEKSEDDPKLKGSPKSTNE